MELAERVQRGRRAIALARQRGINTAPWEGFLEGLEGEAALVEWAGDNPDGWKRIHGTLLRIYPPTWVSVDYRCTLVAWAAAWLSLTQAKKKQANYESLPRALTERETAAMRGGQADVGFWGRLTRRLQFQVPTALAQDPQASKDIGEAGQTLALR